MSSVAISPELAETMRNRSGLNGKAGNALSKKVFAKKQQLKLSRDAKAASIINFTPMPLRLESGINFTVPTPADPKWKDTDEIFVQFRGRKIRGARLTIQEPYVYPRITDASPENKDSLDLAVKKYDVDACTQVEIAHTFWMQANEGASDSEPTGGVVVYEGDKHTWFKNLSNGTVPVPFFEPLPDGARAFGTSEQNLAQLCQQAIEKMYLYCMSQLQLAQDLFNNPEQRGNITGVHRRWAEFALANGWIPTPPQWVFATTVQNQADQCKGCGADRKSADAHFCSCGRPYDAYEAFMAGESVAPIYLTSLPKDKLDKVLVEQKRRGEILKQLGA